MKNKKCKIDCKECKFWVGEIKQLHDFLHGFVSARICSKTRNETYDCGCFGCAKGEEINKSFLYNKLAKIYRCLYNFLFYRQVKINFVKIRLPLVKSKLPELELPKIADIQKYKKNNL